MEKSDRYFRFDAFSLDVSGLHVLPIPQDGVRVVVCPEECVPFLECDVEFEDLACGILVECVSTSDSPSVRAKSYFGCRVGAGEPTRMQRRVDGLIVDAWDWTDGVRDIVTIFARCSPNALLHLEAFRFGFRADVPEALALLDEVVRRISWTARSNRGQAWPGGEEDE